jgi:NADPH:quinone reductase-like Zn-dependent oxidoreductase
MFAVYATHADPDNPLAALKIDEQPEPSVPENWVREKVSHASLNRHDLFTLRGITAHPEGIKYPSPAPPCVGAEAVQPAGAEIGGVASGEVARKSLPGTQANQIEPIVVLPVSCNEKLYCQVLALI